MGAEDEKEKPREEPFDAVAAKRKGEKLAEEIWPFVREKRGVGDLTIKKAPEDPEKKEEEF